MRFIATCAHQLDLAAQQLESGTAVGGRLGLILVDNGVELLLHRHANEAASQHRSRFTRGPKAALPNAIEAALGHDFSAKVALALDAGVLDSDTADFVRSAHHWRNEAYHLGVRHDDIMWNVAWHYHEVACETWVRDRPRSLSSAAEADWVDLIGRHLPSKSPSEILDEDAFAHFCSSLRAMKPKRTEHLAITLSRSVTTRLDDLHGALDYISQNNPKGLARSEVIRDVQWWSALFEDQPVGGYDLEDPAQAAAWEARSEYMKKEWQPKINDHGLSRWRERAKRLSEARKLGASCQNYLSLLREMEPFEAALEESCMALDQYIEGALEDARMGES